jgi:hypothetical protein
MLSGTWATIASLVLKFIMDLLRGKMTGQAEEIGALKAGKASQEKINEAQQTAIEVRDEVDRDKDLGTTIDRL